MKSDVPHNVISIKDAIARLLLLFPEFSPEVRADLDKFKKQFPKKDWDRLIKKTGDEDKLLLAVLSALGKSRHDKPEKMDHFTEEHLKRLADARRSIEGTRNFFDSRKKFDLTFELNNESVKIPELLAILAWADEYVGAIINMMKRSSVNRFRGRRGASNDELTRSIFRNSLWRSMEHFFGRPWAEIVATIECIYFPNSNASKDSVSASIRQWRVSSAKRRG